MTRKESLILYQVDELSLGRALSRSLGNIEPFINSHTMNYFQRLSLKKSGLMNDLFD